MRVLDSFGTEAMYNDKKYAKERNIASIYGGLSIDLRQFYTFYRMYVMCS